MAVTAVLDDIGRPAWIGLTVVSFILCWPVGLVLLGYLIGSGRMSCGRHRGYGSWRDGMERVQQGMDRMQAAAGRWCGPRGQRATGNRAFDEYRAETLRRLEDEQREFIDFLDRLRHARDRAEFDQFMSERSRRPTPPAEPEPPTV